MTQHHTINVSAVAWQEGDQWVAQGIEYDIVAHAADVASLPQAFEDAVVENAFISIHLGRKPLEGIKPGPAKYRDMFEQARTMLSSVPRVRAASQVPVPEIRIRVAAHA